MNAEWPTARLQIEDQPRPPGYRKRSSGQELRGRLMRGRRFDWSIACAGTIQSFGRRISRGL